VPSAIPGSDLACPLDTQHVFRVVRHAFAHPWPGNEPLDCRAHFIHTFAIHDPDALLNIAFSLDTGYHASGWFPNSTMDRCLHLSLSHPHPERKVMLPNGRIGIATEAPSYEEAALWARVFFPSDYAKATWEPSASPLNIDGRLPGVVHWRLWLDQNNKPIIPTGEAYTILPYADGSSPAKVTEGRLGADVR
jgi:hypothetical protein